MSVSPEAVRVTIAPMLSVRRGAEAVAFYKKAFGATELYKIEAGDGAVVAELVVHGAKFWVADESPPHQNFSPETLKGSTSAFGAGRRRSCRSARAGRGGGG